MGEWNSISSYPEGSGGNSSIYISIKESHNIAHYYIIFYKTSNDAGAQPNDYIRVNMDHASLDSHEEKVSLTRHIL